VSQLELSLPFNYTPRDYQRPSWRAYQDGCKRFAAVWHRRAGKDKNFLNLAIMAMTQRVGTYYYFVPTYNQGKKILWDGMGGDGFRFMHHFPGFDRPGTGLVKAKDETDMQVTLINGSIFQIVGTDKMARVVGTNPVGCLYSEFALQKKDAWDFARPILMENGGWAMFVSTPRGKNHFYDLWQGAKADQSWYTSLLTVRDTKRPDGSPVISEEDIEAERKAGMEEELVQQEFYCSFTGSVQGAFYTAQLAKADAERRLGHFPYDPQFPVQTWWDLGIDDKMAIVYVQYIGHEIRFIDYMEHRGEGFPWYIAEMQRRGYAYADIHVGPHDLRVKEYSDKRRVETAAQLGLNFHVSPKIDLIDGVQQVREKFHRFTFNTKGCPPGQGVNRLVDCLANYKRKLDEELQMYKREPEHSQYSHGADAVRNGILGFVDAGYTRITGARQEFADADFDPFTYHERNSGLNSEAEVDFDPWRN